VVAFGEYVFATEPEWGKAAARKEGGWAGVGLQNTNGDGCLGRKRERNRECSRNSNYKRFEFKPKGFEIKLSFGSLFKNRKFEVWFKDSNFKPKPFKPRRFLKSKSRILFESLKSNYLLWQIQVMPAICAAKLEGLLTIAEKAPPKQITSKDDKGQDVLVHNPAYSQWVARD
jgi:hypothetical protein